MKFIAPILALALFTAMMAHAEPLPVAHTVSVVTAQK